MKTATSLLKLPVRTTRSAIRNRTKSLAYNRESCFSCILKIRYDDRIQNLLLEQLNFI